MSNIWYSSDWHLSHHNLRKVFRPQFSSSEEMDLYIIEKFFSEVKNGDRFYFLGDLAWNKQIGQQFFERLKKTNIQFYFVYGNHDKKLWKKSYLSKYCTTQPSWIKDIKIDSVKIALCHYPMLSWNCSHYNAYMLHGHHHSNAMDRFQGKRMNVCLDMRNYQFVTHDEVLEYMKNQPDNWDLIKKEN